MEGHTSYQNDAVPSRLFGSRRPMYDVFGGGKVADVFLWKNPKLSALLLLGITMIWVLFEVLEYSFVTLFCHIFISAMLVFFIWCTLAELFKCKPPRIPEFVLDESAFQHAAVIMHSWFNYFLSKLLDIGCGKDLKSFFVAMGTLAMLSVVGNYTSSVNLLFTGYICLQTLPFLYEKYEDDVDFLAGQLYLAMKRWYMMFDSRVLEKIPRGPIRDRKIR